MSYGAEVWGPDAILEMFDGFGRSRSGEPRRPWPTGRKKSNPNDSSFEKALNDPMVCLQTKFLSIIAGASAPTRRLLYAEFSQVPLQWYWAKLVFNFWNRLVSQPHTLANAVFQEDIKIAANNDFIE